MNAITPGTTVEKALRFFVPIQKVDTEQRMVWGYASTEAVDSDGEIVKREAIEAALPGYMQFANVREMHQLSAVGVAKEAEVDDKGLYIGVKVVDDDAWIKVTEGVYKGFSIGGKATARDPNDRKVITGIELIEISLVDRPANPEALIEAFKAAGITTDAVPLVRKARQLWDCGVPGHEHATEAQADACIHEQDARFGSIKAASDAVELRKFIAGEISKLNAVELEASANALRKSLGGELEAKPAPKPTVLKEITAAGASAPEDKLDPALVDTFAARAARTDFGKCTDLAGVCGLVGAPEPYVRAALEKLRDNYSKLGAVAPATLVPALQFVGAASVAKKKSDSSKDDKPEGDYGSHSDAGYADPGYQDDKKPRYPLKENGKYSEKRIRAAWNYVNKPKNENKYSSKQLKEIKDTIIAAWKEAIDPDGPPSAADGKSKAIQHGEGKTMTNALLAKLGKADASGSVRKGLYCVISAISLLSSLDYLQEQLAQEEGIEGDDSPMPDRFKGLVESLAELVQQLLEEEVEELLENREASDLADTTTYFAYAQKALSVMKGAKDNPVLALLEKAIDDRTGSPGFAALEALLEKATEVAQSQEWGNRPGGENDSNDKWVEKAQSIHDQAVSMGAMCTAKAVADELGKKKKTTKDADGDDDGDQPAGKKTRKDADGDDDGDKSGGKSKKKDADNGKKNPPPPKGDDEEDDDDDAENNGGKSKKKKAAGGVVTMDQLASVLTSFKADMVETVKDTINGLRRNPPAPGTLKSVTKGQDVTVDHDDKTALPDPEKDPEGHRKAVLGEIFKRPNIVTR